MQALARAKSTVDSLHERLADIPLPSEPGSALATDEENTPRLVHPAQSASHMMKIVSDCLVGAFRLFAPENASGVAPIEVLLRTVLIGSCRVVYILSPEDPQVRKSNAESIAHADFDSGATAWKALGDFQHTIENAAATRDLFTNWRQEFPPGRPVGEARLINGMLEAIQTYLDDPEDAPFLREQFFFMWHGYSAVAHTNTWQISLSSTSNRASTLATTGSLVNHLVALVHAADFGMNILDLRSRA